jgi:uncharacterized coiled-coil DUF342 family protein
MKQGKTEKAVFTKLSTEKVELNAIADIKKQSEKISQEYAELSRSARRYLGELDSIADKAFALEKRANVAVDDANAVAKKINELGMDMPDELKSAAYNAGAIRSDAGQLGQVTRKASDAIGGIE